jgi:CheY-like chemotaxis protein
VHSYFHVVPLCRGHHRLGDEQALWGAGTAYVGKVSRVPIAPIVFITALDEEASRADATSTACIAYLRKPAPRLLIGAIEKATSR